MKVPGLEVELGMETYASGSPGIGGKIRSVPEDFIVEEILTDGSVASIQSGKTSIPQGWGRYVLCSLVKKNWDNLIVLRKIAECLGIDEDFIQIAGIKDARALTSQFVTVSRVPPIEISKVKIRNVNIKPLRFYDEKLSSNLLFGNQFHITVRDIRYSEATVEKRIEKVLNELNELGGLPNYFGHQRFGTIRPITHRVGRYLVKRKIEEAVLAFLSESTPFEQPDSREARLHLKETHDFKVALKYFPKRLHYERLMLTHLARYPQDFAGALRRLPLRLLRLFVQAYQAFLFNRFLSGRIRRGIPLAVPQIGHYVVDIDENGLPTNRLKRVGVTNLSKITEKIEEEKARVALPLVGFRKELSNGVQGEIEREILEGEHLKPEDFRIPQFPKLSLPGGRRTVLTSIIKFQIEVSEDAINPSKSIVRTDFVLHRGSYATVLLRELMKPKNLIEAGF